MFACKLKCMLYSGKKKIIPPWVLKDPFYFSQAFKTLYDFNTERRWHEWSDTNIETHL